MITMPTIPWNRIGRKMNAHSTRGSTLPSAWMLNTLFWNVAGPFMTLAFTVR